MLDRPLRPDETVEQKKQSMPPEVFNTFNELILEDYEDGKSTVRTEDVVERLEEKGFDAEEIYARGWLHVKNIYEQDGWEVTYNVPGVDDIYSPYFVFKQP